MLVDRNNWNELSKIPFNSVRAIIHSAYDLKKDLNTDPAEVLDSNIVSTGRSLKLCKDTGIEQFVFISSCSVYGDSSNTSEEKAKTPITINGFTKAYNEELVMSFCKANNINYLILRPFNSYGGNDTFSVVQKLIFCAQNNQVFNLANGGIAERDFIHVEDVAKMTYMLMEKNLSNAIVNVGSGESVRILDLVKAIEAKFGMIKVNKINKPDEAIYSRANLKKLRELIDYEPMSIFDFIQKL